MRANLIRRSSRGKPRSFTPTDSPGIPKKPSRRKKINSFKSRRLNPRELKRKRAHGTKTMTLQDHRRKPTKL